MATQEVLTRTIGALADTLVDDFDVVDLLSMLTDRCVEAFDVAAAGLMLAAPIGTDLQVMAASSGAMHDLEIFELQANEGTCLDCSPTGQTIIVDDPQTGGTWQHSPLACPGGWGRQWHWLAPAAYQLSVGR